MAVSNRMLSRVLAALKWSLRLLVFSFGLALIAVMLAAIVVPVLPGPENGLTTETSRTVFTGAFVVSAVTIIFFSVLRLRRDRK